MDDDYTLFVAARQSTRQWPHTSYVEKGRLCLMVMMMLLSTEDGAKNNGTIQPQPKASCVGRAGQGRRRMTMGERAFHSYAITCTVLLHRTLKIFQVKAEFSFKCRTTTRKIIMPHGLFSLLGKVVTKKK